MTEYTIRRLGHLGDGVVDEGEAAEAAGSGVGGVGALVKLNVTLKARSLRGLVGWFRFTLL